MARRTTNTRKSKTSSRSSRREEEAPKKRSTRSSTRSSRREEEAPTKRSTRSSSRSSGRSTRSTGRSRKGGGDNKNVLYIGLGVGGLCLIGLIVVLAGGESSGKKNGDVAKPSATEGGRASRTTSEAYTVVTPKMSQWMKDELAKALPAGVAESSTQAKAYLTLAKRLFLEGVELEGKGRNAALKRASVLCQKILESDHASSSTKASANKTKIDCKKHMTL